MGRQVGLGRLLLYMEIRGGGRQEGKRQGQDETFLKKSPLSSLTTVFNKFHVHSDANGY